MASLKTCIAVTLALFLSPERSHAILFHSTATPTFNTSAPTGSLAGSGWEWQGQWGGFSGTPIGPYYFISAKHLGLPVGEEFYFQGKVFTTTAMFPDSESDLVIWRVSEPFSTFAPLYLKNDEVGKTSVILGRGTQRGAEVRASSLLGGSVLKGWTWGTVDSIQRWGQNKVEAIVAQSAFGVAGTGSFMKFSFDAGAGANEATLSVGDSGGAVFIQDGANWRLAGINYSVDGNYNTTSTGAGFSAAIFDESGLYRGTEGNWQYRAAKTASSFYATRISQRAAWIQGILALPVPQPLPVLEAATSPNGNFTPASNAQLNEAVSAFTLPKPTGNQFYRVRSNTAKRIKSISTAGGNLQMAFE